MLCVCVSHCFGPNFWRCSKHEYIPNCMPSLVWNQILQEYHKMFRYICTLHNGVPRHCLEQFVQFWQFLQPSWWTNFFATCLDQVAGPPLEAADQQLGMPWLNGMWPSFLMEVIYFVSVLFLLLEIFSQDLYRYDFKIFVVKQLHPRPGLDPLPSNSDVR